MAIVPVPTREPAGQAPAASCAVVQSAVAPLVLAPSPAGSVTAALACPAWPAGWLIVAVNGTCAVTPVAPGPPIDAAIFGVNASLPQSVGVNELVPETGVVGAL